VSDVVITFSVLNELNGSLKQILVEFEDATKRGDAVEAAIGNPCGRGELRQAAEVFENGWDARRKYLKDDLAKVQEHVEAVGSKWAEWDTEASNKLSVDSE
jgi:hypothetical protein